MKLFHEAPDGIGLADVRVDPDTPGQYLTSVPRGILFKQGGFLLIIPMQECTEDEITLGARTVDDPTVFRIAFPLSPSELERRHELITLPSLRNDSRSHIDLYQQPRPTRTPSTSKASCLRSKRSYGQAPSVYASVSQTNLSRNSRMEDTLSSLAMQRTSTACWWSRHEHGDVRWS